MMKKITKVLFTIFIILFTILIGTIIFFFISIQPVSKNSNIIRVDIKEGMSSKTVINVLESKGVIKNRTFALLYSKLFKKPSFKAGSFDLDNSWNLDELFEYMSNDRNIIESTIDFTILPGSTIRMIALNLQESTNLNANELIKKWNDKSIGQGCDLIVKTAGDTEIFIEVKTSKRTAPIFAMTTAELVKMEEKKEKYFLVKINNIERLLYQEKPDLIVYQSPFDIFFHPNRIKDATFYLRG